MFVINNIEWDIVFLPPASPCLRRSDGSVTCGVTDFGDKCVYLSNMLQGEFLRKVIAHELCHCFCFSFNISMPIEQEEYLADWISLYGTDLIYLLDDLMRNILRRVA